MTRLWHGAYWLSRGGGSYTLNLWDGSRLQQLDSSSGLIASYTLEGSRLFWIAYDSSTNAHTVNVWDGTTTRQLDSDIGRGAIRYTGSTLTFTVTNSQLGMTSYRIIALPAADEMRGNWAMTATLWIMLMNPGLFHPLQGLTQLLTIRN